MKLKPYMEDDLGSRTIKKVPRRRPRASRKRRASKAGVPQGMFVRAGGTSIYLHNSG
ncbi:MAG: hypothetical protein JWM46_559 [Candidatus Kaiserbacteria bacterium]|nr:hypothetical protein [Candidatus Kaiserbacteria bacterium]